MFHHRSFGTADLVALMAAHRAAAQQEATPCGSLHSQPAQHMAGEFNRLAMALQREVAPEDRKPRLQRSA
jgi:hypothetical protein